MVDEPRKRSRFDQTEPEPPRKSRFDRRSRSPARRSRSPAALSSPSTVGGKNDPIPKDVPTAKSSSKSPAPAVDPAAAAMAAAAAAARINAQLLVNTFPYIWMVPPANSLLGQDCHRSSSEQLLWRT
jgi:hypothetical protein